MSSGQRARRAGHGRCSVALGSAIVAECREEIHSPGVGLQPDTAFFHRRAWGAGPKPDTGESPEPTPNGLASVPPRGVSD